MDLPFKKIGSLLVSIAPTIASAMGGPLFGTAVSALSKCVLGKEGGTVDEIEKKVMEATDPNLYLQITKADNDFKVSMQQAGVDIERINAEDRESARQRETIVKDTTPKKLAYIALLSFWIFAITGIVIYMKENLDTTKLTAIVGFISTVLGYAISEVKQVFNYYFGSSSGSTTKTDIISQIVTGK